MGNGIPHLHFLSIFYSTDDVAHLASTQLLLGHHVHFKHAHLIGRILHARIEKLHVVALAYNAVHHLEVGNNSTKGIKHRVEDKCLQWSIIIACGMWHPLHNGIKDVFNALARLTRCAYDVGLITTQQFNDLVFNFFWHGAGHVHLVDDGNNLQIVFDGHIEVRDGLRLYALCCVYNEQCPFAGGDTA